MWSAIRRAFSLLSMTVLVGLAGCDSNEPQRVLEVLAQSDTLEFHNEFGRWVNAEDWFSSEDGTPVHIAVLSDDESIVWVPGFDGRNGHVKATRPTLAPIRIVGSAAGYRDMSVSIVARAYGDCPMSVARDDYFPLDSTASTTYDYVRQTSTRTTSERLVGILSVRLASVSCEDETRTAIWNRTFTGTRIAGAGSFGGPDPDTTQVEMELAPLRTRESGNHLVTIRFPAELNWSLVVSRYPDLGGAAQVREVFPHKIELAPNVGIVSLSFSNYLGSGFEWSETWTRR